MKSSALFFTFLVFLFLTPGLLAETEEMTADEHYLMGNAYSSFGQFENATSEYRQALVLKPDYTDAWNNLGIVLNRQELYEEALSAADNATRISPNDADAWYNRGYTLGMMKRYDEEIDSYRQALALKPNLSSAWENMGVSYFDLGKYDEAIGAFRNETTYDPDNAIAWYYLGTVYEKTGKLEDAAGAFEKSIKISPNMTMVQDRLEKVKKNLTLNNPESRVSANSSEEGKTDFFSGLLGLFK